MRKLTEHLAQKTVRNLRVGLTLLVLVLNVAVIVVNTIHITNSMEDQNVRLVDMVSHLETHTDETAVLTYLEHYGHTHAVTLRYLALDGTVLFETDTPPKASASYSVMRDEDVVATIIIDNAQSNLWVSNVTYITVTTAMLIAIYVSALLIANRKVRTVLSPVLDDFTAIKSAMRSLAFDRVYGFVELQDINDTFEATYDRLKRVERDHKARVQTLAHDIKTPLTVINGLVEGIVSHRIEPDEKTHQSLQEEIARIGELLERIISEDAREAHTTFELAAVIKASIDRHRPVFDRQGVTPTYDLHHTLISGDADDIRRVVDHLIANALKHTERGDEIRITMQETTPVMVVEDTGHGMDEATRDNLFEPVESANGTGVGLVLVKRILDAHGATIDVASVPGEGTRVTVDFSS